MHNVSREIGRTPYFRSSGMWCLIIIDLALSYTYMLLNMGPQNYYYQTPHPQTPHPWTPDNTWSHEVFLSMFDKFAHAWVFIKPWSVSIHEVLWTSMFDCIYPCLKHSLYKVFLSVFGKLKHKSSPFAHARASATNKDLLG